MATVNKNFRIKNGLVVEGSTATVNGQNILTETGSDQYILNLIGGETLVKSVSGDFTVSAGGELQIKNSSDLARTGDITSAINALDTDAIEEGSTNQYFTDTRAKMAVFGQDATLYDIFNSATTTNITASYIPTMGLTLTAENGVADSTTDDLEEGSSNQYFSVFRALDAVTGAGSGSVVSTYLEPKTSGGVPYIDVNTTALDGRYDASGTADTAISNALAPAGTISTAIETAQNNAEDYADTAIGNALYPSGNYAFDPYGSASTAEGNANTYTDNAINALDTDDIEEGTTNKYYSDSRARAALSGVGGVFYDSSKGEISLDSTIATQSYVNNAIDNLVDGAPGLLDTLNEIAAAINDDANYFTTIANQIAGKQDTLTAGSNIDITSNTISVTGLTTDDVSEGSNKYATAENIIDELTGYGTIDLGSVDIDINGAVSAGELNSNILRSEDGSMNRYTVSNSIATAGTATTGAQFAASVGTSVKYLIKLNTNFHSHVWEALATVDGSNNIAVTEYAEVTTNGSLGSASYSVDSDGKGGYTLNLAITSTYNNTSYKVIAEQL
jgi:hypothetical protein